MSRKMIVENSETGRTVIEYGRFSLAELDKQIKAYEKKHGMVFVAFHRGYNHDYASDEETTDFMDWENLVEEKKLRMAKPRSGGKKKEMAYEKG